MTKAGTETTWTSLCLGSEFLQLPVGRNCINVRNYQACFLLRVQHAILTSPASFIRTDIYWVLGAHPGLFQGFTQSSHTLGGKPDGSLTAQLVKQAQINQYVLKNRPKLARPASRTQACKHARTHIYTCVRTTASWACLATG